MSKKIVTAQPLFDISISDIPENIIIRNKNSYAQQDLSAILNFLRKYDGNKSTFENYKRETERLCQWSWLIAKKSILQLQRQDIENYLKFCQKPPKSWIGTRSTCFRGGQRALASTYRYFR